MGIDGFTHFSIFSLQGVAAIRGGNSTHPGRVLPEPTGSLSSLGSNNLNAGVCVLGACLFVCSLEVGLTL